MTVTIVPITLEHAEGYRVCVDSVARERVYLGILESKPIESVTDYIKRCIDNDCPFMVAMNDSTVVGWCDIVPYSLEGFRHRAAMGMGLHRDFRGQGIGERLLRAALTAAEKRGLERIELEVYASNEPAIRLYEKVGFAREGVRVKARKLDGVYYDLVMMAMFMNRES